MAKKKIEPRYIDVNFIKEALLGWDTDPTDEEIEYAIDNIPTADVEEVKYGEWIDIDPLEWDCSLCGYRVKRWNSTPYCPHCGAKMDGGSGK